MSHIKTIVTKLVAACALTAAAMVPAHATVFTVSSATLTTPNGGYGIDGGENGGNLLDVRFVGVTGETFELGVVGSMDTFKIGTVRLAETDAGNGQGNPGIKPAEQNDLQVVGLFTFTETGASAATADKNATVNGTGLAFTGLIKDNNGVDSTVDYSLSFTGTTVDFGTTGKYSLTLSPLSFTSSGTLLDLFATVTLLQADVVEDEGTSNEVPEPGSLALFGLAALGLAFARSRKNG